jgi:polyhydroxyalkanoate synthesis repressor PhaR
MPTGDQRREAGSAGAEPVSVVRYPNRRLYDRSQGRYVTLQEIAAMVREGKAVSVRDSKTNDDLTSVILTQIILEHHPERMELLPVPILHEMIRTNSVVLGLLREYFHQSLAYLEFWERASALNPMAASVGWLKSLLPTRPVGGSGEPPASAGGPADAEALARRIAEMERRLNALDRSAGKSEEDAAAPGARRRAGRDRRPSRRAKDAG